MSNQNETAEWVFENEDDKLFGIETRRYSNGQVVKRCTLSDGRIAEAKRLKGNDGREITRLSGGDEERFRTAVMAMCLTVDGAKLTVEEIEQMWFDDVTKLNMISSVNFPSAQKV